MSFVIKQTTSYSWPVSIEQPVDGGRHVKHTFDAEFKRLNQTRIEEIMADAMKGDLRDSMVADEILVGWTGISDGGEELPYSEKLKAELLDMQLVSASIVKAWMESLAGAKRKN